METKSRIPRNNPVLLNCCLCIETEAETETGRPSLLHSPLVVLLILVFEKPPKPTKIIVIIINGCRRRTTKTSRSSFSVTIRSQSKTFYSVELIGENFVIGIIKRKALIKELAALYHAECLAYCQELLELQKKWEEPFVETKAPDDSRKEITRLPKRLKKTR